MAELKNTKQRTAILRVLKSLAEPASAEEVFSGLKEDFPSLALSTVYRNLERFAAAGLVKKDSFNDGIIRYSLAEEHHGHYLICTECDCKIKIDD
jgi:Fe2+ or Zn2+ uptake regulation protein